VVGVALELVAAHDRVRLDELRPEELDDLLVLLEQPQRLVERRRERRLRPVLLGGRPRRRLELELLRDPQQAGACLL
jgi:hypothetical protein